MTQISAIIITLNEESNIEACIRSLDTVCTEVIVVDSGSTDLTREIAKRCGAKVISNEWKGYGHARNHGAALASQDVILSIDADERLSIELSEKIRVTEIDENLLYKFHRLNYYKDRWIYHGHLFPEWKARIYSRKIFKWNDAQVHERLISSARVKTSKLAGDLYHFRNSNVSHWKSKYEQYAQLAAKEWQLRGYSPPGIKKYLSPYYHFIYSFFFCFGFLDLKTGWELAYHKYYATKKKIEAFERL